MYASNPNHPGPQSAGPWYRTDARLSDIRSYLEHPEPDVYETLELISLRSDLAFLLNVVEDQADHVHNLTQQLERADRRHE